MMRIPLALKQEVKCFIETRGYEVPKFATGVRAGLPTYVQEESADRVSLVEHLTEHPEETFLVPAQGDSMVNANIFDGDMLVVNARLEAKDGAIVVASIDGDCTVKRLRHIKGKTVLFPENKDYSPIPIEADMDFHIWGVVCKKTADVR